MPLTVLPFDASLSDYGGQADSLFSAWRDGEPWAVELFHQHHPRFLDDQIRWLPKRLSADEIRAAELDAGDARFAVARWYDFADWISLAMHVETVSRSSSLTARFESAVESVITGNVAALAAALASDRDLVHARSARVTHFDPTVHRATLLHYVAANGVENYRQKTPPNAVEIARTLLEAGAAPDALADMYGGQCTTMSMLVSSVHPAQAGVQVGLIDTLADHGATVEALGGGAWTSPLLTALVFRFTDAAEALVRRGARVETLPAAAGLGRADLFDGLLSTATPEARHRALALAAQLGRTQIVRRLLDAGEDPNLYNPPGTHAHATPLHHAALHGYGEVVRLLVERGARTDMRDKIYNATPLGWAEHGGRLEVAKWLAGVSEVRGEK